MTGNVEPRIAVPTAGPLPHIDLARIRQHETSQQRAWEELGYILVPDIEGPPPRSAGVGHEVGALLDGGPEGVEDTFGWDRWKST